MDVGLNFFEVPGKGPYATLARCVACARGAAFVGQTWPLLKRPLTAAMHVSLSADKLFECHIRLEAATKATFAKVSTCAIIGRLERAMMRLQVKLLGTHLVCKALRGLATGTRACIDDV